MATWITHLRIAERFIDSEYIPKAYIEEFLEGSLAPDCGYGAKDSFGDFNPPPQVTHWAPYGTKVFCQYQEFYDIYLKDKSKDSEYYFYFGYYIHLISDTLWSTMIYMPNKLKYSLEYQKDPMFLNIVKKDWYDIDFRFLQENKGYYPFTVLQNINSVGDYLSYYEEGQLTNQIRYIVDYYKDFDKRELMTEYKYLSPKEVQAFVDTAYELIGLKL